MIHRHGGNHRGDVKEAYREIWELLAKDEFVVLDTETTGLDNPEMVSVAVIDRSGTTLLNERVRPSKPIEPGASEITGIRDADVADAPRFPEIYAAFRASVEGKRVVIYNSSYDMKVIRNTCAQYDLATPQFEPWCAMMWFARIFGEWDSRRASYRWQRLSAAAQFYGVAQIDAHDALGDTLTTLAVVDAALEQARRTIAPAAMDPLFPL